jgi:hypothetical protein
MERRDIIPVIDAGRRHRAPARRPGGEVAVICGATEGAEARYQPTVAE